MPKSKYPLKRKYNFPLSMPLPSPQTVRPGFHFFDYLAGGKVEISKRRVMRVTRNGFYCKRIKGRTLEYISFGREGMEFYERLVSDRITYFSPVVGSEDIQAALFVYEKQVRGRLDIME